MNITKEYDGKTFTFRLGEHVKMVNAADYSSGKAIIDAVMEWAREIDPSARLAR